VISGLVDKATISTERSCGPNGCDHEFMKSEMKNGETEHSQVHSAIERKPGGTWSRMVGELGGKGGGVRYQIRETGPSLVPRKPNRG